VVKKTKKASKKKCCNWNNRVSNMTYHDIKHAKLATVAFTFFLISVWSGLATWVVKVHWAWFLGLAILFSIKPWVSFWSKK